MATTGVVLRYPVKRWLFARCVLRIPDQH